MQTFTEVTYLTTTIIAHIVDKTTGHEVIHYANYQSDDEKTLTHLANFYSNRYSTGTWTEVLLFGEPVIDAGTHYISLRNGDGDSYNLQWDWWNLSDAT